MHVSDTDLSDPEAYALDQSGPVDWGSLAQLGYGLLCAAAVLAALFAGVL